MRNIIFTLSFLFLLSAAQAQLTVTGMLKDTAHEAISSATVMLLHPKDSTLANFTSSDAKGNFAFKNVKKSNYILKISHISYMPREFFITATEEKEINMGVIEMKQIASFLMEIVIREAKAPIFIKGDTVEYDATTFKA
ncbi:MAG: carboxypeptidase-like regulatory domain-containing protein, partial [Lentimicrobiaceae bacterium]|nr:carboxypeptidase-like regulatory domain-containing protein [Lentimicrobiaceae bacterium]